LTLIEMQSTMQRIIHRKQERIVALTLRTAEKKIEANIQKEWYENGLILMEIRDRRLYKEKYGTFEEYVEKRWDWSRVRAHHMISAAQNYQLLAAQNVNKNAVFVNKTDPIQLPKNEAQVRPLSSLETPEERVHVWKMAVDAAEEQGKTTPTMAIVEKAVEEFKAEPISLNPVDAPDYKFTSSSSGVLYGSGLLLGTKVQTAGENDECYTPAYAVKALLPHLEKFIGKTIWCPFDKESSQFVQVLREHGHTVVHSHIDQGLDFYVTDPDQWDVMVSNPPFTNKRQIFERAISFGKPFALIMSNTWLNDAAPKQIFRDINFQLLMFEERMKFLNQDNSENKITFSSSYFCRDFLTDAIMFDSLKEYGYGE